MKMFAKQLINLSSKLPTGSSAVLNICRAASTTSNQHEPRRIEKTINSVQLLGRVGVDPQRKGSDRQPIVVFSLATHTNYRYESGEFLQRTEWHRVICFKPGLRETIMNFLKKGQRVHVTGRITYGEIKGDDGQSRTTTAVTADDVIFFHHTPESSHSHPESLHSYTESSHSHPEWLHSHTESSHSHTPK